MKKDQVENLILISVLIAREHVYSISHFEAAKNIGKLQKLSTSLRKRYEAVCNYQWANTEAYAIKTEKLEAKAVALGEALGIEIEHQRDPRGCALKFTLDNREYAFF